MAYAGQRRPARDRRHDRSGHGARRSPGRRRAAWWVAPLGGTVLVLSLAAAPHGPVAQAATSRAATSRATCDGQPAPWMDPRLSPDQRASLLVSNMTLDQEAQETAAVSTATESREVPAIPSLCIPALLLTNGSAGISTGGPVQYPATALPAPISLAATWDPAAAARYGEVEGSEALAQGRNDVEGPDINIARVPTNGRTFEAYGEDPYLVGQITFPASDSAVPASTPQQYPGVNGTAVYSEDSEVGYRYDDAQGITPLFPFGFGLSYTTFAFSHLTVSGPTAGNHPVVRVTAEVTNTGGRAGTEVAQLYVGDPAAIQEPPRQLRAFQRVYLRPGQHKVLHFTLPVGSVAYWDTAAQGWAVAPGSYQVYVGDSSALANLPLRGSFALATPSSQAGER